ncbi:MAG: hypothetical protein VW378_06470 [bacterium]
MDETEFFMIDFIAYVTAYQKQFACKFTFRSLLSAFSDDYLLSYLKNPSVFSLALHRPPGEGVLYGLEQVEARQSFFNSLSKLQRLSLIKEKLQHVSLWALFSDHQSLSSLCFSDLKDVYDIGAGHSVYLMHFLSGSFVLKQESMHTHCFMTGLLKALGWVYLESYHLKNDRGAWELSEYAGPFTLEKWLYQPYNSVTTMLVERLARHAALGDCIGRGDRHFENYVFKSESLVPIDLCYLFSEYHEKWVMTYTKAGMSELGVIQAFYYEPDKLLDAVSVFFKEYSRVFEDFRSQKQIFLSVIEQYFKQSTNYNRYVSFLEHRLTHPHYLASQCRNYLLGFLIFLKRYTYKQLMQKVVVSSPDVFKNYPLLEMYYQADLNRFSSFFLLDEFERGNLLPLIDSLAKENAVSSVDLFKHCDLLCHMLRSRFDVS